MIVARSWGRTLTWKCSPHPRFALIATTGRKALKSERGTIRDAPSMGPKEDCKLGRSSPFLVLTRSHPSEPSPVLFTLQSRNSASDKRGPKALSLATLRTVIWWKRPSCIYFESLCSSPTQGGKIDLELGFFTFRFPALVTKGGHESSGHIGHCGLFLRHVSYLVDKDSHLVLMLEREP